MIHVQNISVKRGHTPIIRDVSFDIHPGKVSVVIGKNGAGKSTLLETLSGQLVPHSGCIVWEGRSMSSISAAELSRRRAVLSQQVQIAFPLKVYDLVEMGCYVSPGSMCCVSKSGLIQHALEEVGMQDFVNRDFTTLSGGEQKRVMLAKCLVQLHCCQSPATPKYLLLDEPAASLDLQQQYRLIQLIQNLVQRYQIGVWAIFHDINLAALFADEILMLKAGHIVRAGSPQRVLNEDTIHETLGIKSIIHSHPVYGCPQITTLPL